MTPRSPRDPLTYHRSPDDAVLPESRASLWGLTAGPAIWAAHFLLSYITASVWCAKAATVAAPLGSARIAMAAYTGIALVAIAGFGWHAWCRHRWGEAELPHDDASAGDRHRFLGFATLLLCGLSFVAVGYMAIAMSVIGTCR